MPASVTLPLEELDMMRKASEEKDVQITQLKQDLLEAKMSDQMGSIAPMAKLCRHTMEIVTFAVGNLSPEIIKRWPYQALREVATRLALLPDYSINDGDLAAELLKFAAECERWEARRKSEPEKYVPPPPGRDDHGRYVDDKGNVIGAPVAQLEAMKQINATPGSTLPAIGNPPVIGLAREGVATPTPDDPSAA